MSGRGTGSGSASSRQKRAEMRHKTRLETRRKTHRQYVRKLTREFNRVAPPKKAPRDNTHDFYHGTKVPDPYRPLENYEDQAVLDWAWSQMDRFRDFVKDSAAADRVKKYLEDNWDSPTESLPERRGKYTFTYRNNGKQGQSVFYVQERGRKKPRVLIDPNKFSADNSIALSGTYATRDGSLVGYTTSKGGGDEKTIKIRDVATGKDLPDTIENCKYTGVNWDEDNKGFTYNFVEEEGSARYEIRHHRLGDDPKDDTLFYRLPATSKENFPSYYHAREIPSYEFMLTYEGSNTNNGLLMRKKGTQDEFKRVFDSGQASFVPIGEKEGKIYAITRHGAPRGRVIALDPAHPEPENWQTVIPEHKEDLLAGAFIHKGRLFGSYVHEAADRLAMFDMKGNHIHDADLPVQTEFSLAYFEGHEDSLLMELVGFKQRGDVYDWDFEKNELKEVKKSLSKFKMDDFVIERLHATSKDGTQVPMTVVRRKDVKLDGTAALKLYGYGGFNSALGPGLGVEDVSWVREGGIYVQTNLRGGGEFGADWYDQGRLRNKQNVFDDFIACAERLIADKYTSNERLVSEGGSNGGLLTLATMLQRPDLFGAVISEVPVTDMLRNQLLGHGFDWIGDFGDPINSAGDFRASYGYSPVHNVRKGKNYPPCMVTTADHDDNVIPAHAYKFIATLQELAGKDTLALLRVEKNGGHGGGITREQTINEIADKTAFIEKSIGPISQQAYKTWLRVQQARQTKRQNRPKMAAG